MSTDKRFSEILRRRITQQRAPFCANDNISQFIKSPAELAALEEDVATQVKALLHTLVIDTKNDPNTKETAQRVAKMFVREIFSGRYEAQPPMTEFKNEKGLDEIYVVGPISVRSTCSHHFMPIVGHCWIGILPGDDVIGLSKFNRMVDFIMRRPQIQEAATVQIADLLEELVQPEGLGVIVKARHFCMCHRGVQDQNTFMTTSIMRGAFRAEPSIKSEFLRLVEMNKAPQE